MLLHCVTTAGTRTKYFGEPDSDLTTPKTTLVLHRTVSNIAVHPSKGYTWNDLGTRTKHNSTVTLLPQPGVWCVSVSRTSLDQYNSVGVMHLMVSCQLHCRRMDLTSADMTMNNRLSSQRTTEHTHRCGPYSYSWKTANSYPCLHFLFPNWSHRTQNTSRF